MEAYPEVQGNSGSAGKRIEQAPLHGSFPARLMRLANAFEEHGREILKSVQENEPAKLWFFVSGILSWDEAFDLGWDLSDEDLACLVERIVAALREGTPDEAKCSPNVRPDVPATFRLCGKQPTSYPREVVAQP